MDIRLRQDVRKAIDVSESTLYPVLRRLQKGDYLEVYDRQFDGRNRRYYKVTESGRTQLAMYQKRMEKNIPERSANCLREVD